MQPWPDAGLQGEPCRVQVRLGRLDPAAGSELVERVVVGDRRQHPRLADTKRSDQRHVLRRRADPGCRFNWRAAAVPLQGAFEGGAIGRAIDEEFGLADRSGRPGETAEQVVDRQALLGRERQAALLTVAVGRLGRPGLRRQARRAGRPLVPRKIVARETGETIVGLLRVGDGRHDRLHTPSVNVPILDGALSYLMNIDFAGPRGARSDE